MKSSVKEINFAGQQGGQPRARRHQPHALRAHEPYRLLLNHTRPTAFTQHFRSNPQAKNRLKIINSPHKQTPNRHHSYFSKNICLTRKSRIKTVYIYAVPNKIIKSGKSIRYIDPPSKIISLSPINMKTCLSARKKAKHAIYSTPSTAYN